MGMAFDDETPSDAGTPVDGTTADDDDDDDSLSANVDFGDDDESGLPKSAPSDWGSDPLQVAAVNESNQKAREEAIAAGMDESQANIIYPDIDPANPYAIN
jgi:hypothetical protein